MYMFYAYYFGYDLLGTYARVYYAFWLEYWILWWLQIVVEEFLEDINNMLNSGEVPNLFPADEYEKIIAAVRPKAKEHGVPEGDR